MKTIQICRIGGVSILTLAAAGAFTPAHGAAISSIWKSDGTSYTGDFNDPGHWNNGVPNHTDDTANFTANETYTVHFTEATDSQVAQVTGGDVTFDLSGGDYTLSGATSMYVGNGSTDKVDLTVSGGSLSTQVAYVARSGQGTLTLTGQNTAFTTNGAQIYIGYYGTGQGSFTVKGKASAATGATYIGHHEGSNGEALITGDQSTWTTGSVQVGYSGHGTLDIEAGASVSSTTGNIGSYIPPSTPATGSGSATVTGIGSAWTTTGLLVGRSGTGSLSINEGGLVDAGSGTVSVYDLGTLNLGAADPTGHGGGTITAANVNVTGGTIDVIQSNTITGNLTLDSATHTTMHLDDDLNYAQLTGIGTLTFGGVLNVVLDGSYAPTAGAVYHLFDFTGATGSFTNVVLPGLAANLSWNQNDLYTQGTLSVDAVPEPATLGLLALGMGGLLLKRRRR